MAVRGEVVWVSLPRAVGAEQEKRRPAVIISNNAANEAAVRYQRGVVTIVPLSSARPFALPFQVELRQSSTGLPRDAVAQIEQVRAVDISRIESTGNLIDESDLRAIGAALALHCGIPVAR